MKLTLILQTCNFGVMFIVLFLTSLFSVCYPHQLQETNQVKPKVTVYLFLLDECKICREYGPELNELHNKYGTDEIEFIGVFPNFSSKKVNIEKFKEEFDIKFELKTDYFKKLSKRFNAKILPEVFVYDHKLDQVIYSGRIDDRYVSIGQRRQVIKTFNLRTTLDNIISQKDILIRRTQPIGCFINYNDNL